MKPLFFTTSFDADSRGYFGDNTNTANVFGGRYVPEMLIPALDELTAAYQSAITDVEFVEELTSLLKNFVGRPSPLYYAAQLTAQLGGAKVYFKNEGLNHTGAHKINHCIGQALLAKRMGKTRLIAETGAGQHGVATATVAAKFGFECTVHMGAVDVKRQAPNVFWMKQLGAEVKVVEQGTQTLKDAVTSAIQDWIGDPADSYYLLGSALGPHPYPTMVRDFQSIIGLEVAEQIKTYEGEAAVPDYLVACVGGGSNAIGLFNTFLDNPQVNVIGVEAGGKDTTTIGQHAARIAATTPAKTGVVEGYKSLFLQDDHGNIQGTHSVSAGLDYAGIGPQHALLHAKGRAKYVSVSDEEVLNAVQVLATTEGIIPALESAHAVAYALQLAPTLSPDQTMVVNLSGRGDKDYFILQETLSDA